MPFFLGVKNAFGVFLLWNILLVIFFVDPTSQICDRRRPLQPKCSHESSAEMTVFFVLWIRISNEPFFGSLSINLSAVRISWSIGREYLDHLLHLKYLKKKELTQQRIYYKNPPTWNKTSTCHKWVLVMFSNVLFRIESNNPRKWRKRFQKNIFLSLAWNCYFSNST